MERAFFEFDRQYCQQNNIGITEITTEFIETLDGVEQNIVDSDGNPTLSFEAPDGTPQTAIELKAHQCIEKCAAGDHSGTVIGDDCKGFYGLSEDVQEDAFAFCVTREYAEAACRGMGHLCFGIDILNDANRVYFNMGAPLTVPVEEKFGKYFGYLARCEGDIGTTTLKN